MTSLYNTTAWKQLRRWHLAQFALCELCLQRGHVTPASVVHHIDPHRGDEAKFYDRSNLQSVCKTCHDGACQQQEKSGHLRGSDDEGLPLDPKHNWNLEPVRTLEVRSAIHPWFEGADE